MPLDFKAVWMEDFKPTQKVLRIVKLRIFLLKFFTTMNFNLKKKKNYCKTLITTRNASYKHFGKGKEIYSDFT